MFRVPNTNHLPTYAGLQRQVNSSRYLLFFELGSQFQVREYKIAQSLPSLYHVPSIMPCILGAK